MDENCLSVGLSVTLSGGKNCNRCTQRPEILHRETYTSEQSSETKK